MIELPESWVSCTLQDVGDIVSGGTPSTKNPEFWGDEVPWISPSDLTGYTAKFIGRGAKSLTKLGLKKSSAKLMPAGSVHFSSRAPIGYVAVSTQSLCTNQGFKSLVPANGVFNEYIYFYLKSIRGLANSLATGTTFKELSGKAFAKLPLPLPPLAEQKRIVAKIEELFSELDAGEESLRRARRQLGVYRQSLLKQAFEGKLTAPWRAQHPDLLESPDQLLARIQAERQARYQQQLKEWEKAVKEWEKAGESYPKPAKPRFIGQLEPISQKELEDFGELPSGWTYFRLGNAIASIDAGKSFSCDERPPSPKEIGVAKVSAVTWGEYDEGESKTCLDSSKVNPAYFIRQGDFLLSRANTIELVGAVVLVKRAERKIMLSDKTLRIHFGGIDESYVLQYLRSHVGRREIMTRSSGNQMSMRNIGQDRIASIVAPACSLPEQQEIVRLLDAQFEVIEQNEREIDAALKRSEALRQSILKKAFTGQLVPQDPTDEPASALLERIGRERAGFAKPGRKAAPNAFVPSVKSVVRKSP